MMRPGFTWSPFLLLLIDVKMLNPIVIAVLRDSYFGMISDTSKDVQGFRTRFDPTGWSLTDLVREYAYWQRSYEQLIDDEQDARDDAYWADEQAERDMYWAEEDALMRDAADELAETMWDEITDELEGIKPQHNISLELFR